MPSGAPMFFILSLEVVYFSNLIAKPQKVLYPSETTVTVGKV